MTRLDQRNRAPQRSKWQDRNVAEKAATVVMWAAAAAWVVFLFLQQSGSWPLPFPLTHPCLALISLCEAVVQHRHNPTMSGLSLVVAVFLLIYTFL